jgi:hypothetical protein
MLVSMCGKRMFGRPSAFTYMGFEHERLGVEVTWESNRHIPLACCHVSRTIVVFGPMQGCTRPKATTGAIHMAVEVVRQRNEAEFR